MSRQPGYCVYALLAISVSLTYLDVSYAQSKSVDSRQPISSKIGTNESAPLGWASSQTEGSYALAAQTGAGRIAAIDEGVRVRLHGNIHPLATAANDRGETATSLPMQRMLLVLKRDPATESALQELIAAQQDRNSPSFHVWLTPGQFGERFGAAKADIEKLTAWLGSHGFSVNRIANGGTVIEFNGTAGQVKEAFHTPIHSYFVKGKTYFANAADPEIPAALAPAVAGVSTLNSFEKSSPIRVMGNATRIGTSSLWQPDFTFNGGGAPAHYLAPGDFAKIYNTAALDQSGIDGTGQSLAIVARTNINLSDIQIFRLAFGLPANDPQVILNGPNPGNLFGSEETEADLDVEWSGAIAPMATIKLVVSATTNATDGVDLSAQYIVDNNLSPVMSASFGQCEASLGQAENTFFNNLWEQAAAQGITVVVSSGDNGPAGCDSPENGKPASQGPAVSGLASTPFNIAVGGTQFNENGADSTYWAPTNGPDQSSALGFIPEDVWNESCADVNQCGSINLFASSGGASTLYSKPSWQSGPGVPNDKQRDLPDVSLAAAAGHDGYLICQEGICLTDGSGQLVNAEIVGGTSAGAPSFAAIMALVVQKTGSRQGQANFVLYPMAAAQNAANCNGSVAGGVQAQCVFNDITQGNNNVPGQTGTTAGAGYDLATGWGSVNAANLANSWPVNTLRGSSTNLQITPASVTHGQPVTATVTVAPASGTGTPTGEAALLPGSAATLNLGSLASGSVSSANVILPGGSYSVTAAYSGDGTFAASNSNAVPLTVSPEPSTTTFTVPGTAMTGNPPGIATTYSAVLDLDVKVAGASNQGNATGTVTFSDTSGGNTSTLLTVPLNVRGEAFMPFSKLALGSHSLTANYSGDASFQASSGGPINITVAQAPTDTVLITPTGALPGSAATMFALVFPQNGAGSPTGTVQFFVGGKAFGSPVPIKNELATETTTQLTKGANTITAAYSGDGNFLTSTSPAATIYVGNPDFQIAVNPGNLTVTSTTPASAKLLLSPGPGLGFAGPVSFACAGLPTTVTCSFQPSPLMMDGSTTMTDTVTLTKVAATGAARSAALRGLRAIGELGLACAVLLVWPRKSRRTRWAWVSLALLLGVAAIVSGCSGNQSTVVAAPGQNTFSVMVTASGGSGPLAVSHSVTFSLTVQ